MEPRTNLLTDLSVFKFSEATAQGTTNAVILFVAFLVTATISIFAYRWWQRWTARRAARRVTQRVSSELRFPRHLRDMLDHLRRLSGHHDGDELTRDAWAFEHAVEQYYEDDPAADMDSVSELRGLLHINVSNPHLRTESTRQLVPEQPVRLLAAVGEETLDLACNVVDVNEMYLLVHIPEDPDIHAVLNADPRVRLVCWREHEGETLFRTRLEFIPTEGLALVHARHAFRAEDNLRRSDFRLSLDLPLSWRYVERESLARLKAEPGRKLAARHGEGRLVDLGYGGVAFSAAETLTGGGLAQVLFELDGHSLHVMLEVTHYEQRSDGSWLHRGRIRGITHEARDRICTYLSREQISRFRERGLLKLEPRKESP